MKPITVDAIRNRLVPICACCKQIRNDSAEWEQLEAYFFSRFAIEFTHTLCPVHLAAGMEPLHLKPRTRRLGSGGIGNPLAWMFGR
jgi:hypothetical protein